MLTLSGNLGNIGRLFTYLVRAIVSVRYTKYLESESS